MRKQTAIVVLAAALGLASFSLAEAASENLEYVTFSFGDDTVKIERRYLLSGPRGTETKVPPITIAFGEDIFLKVRFEPPLAESRCVKNIRSVQLRNLSIPARGSAGDRGRLNLGAYLPKPTDYPGISKLEPPYRAPVSEYYQFDRTDLRDYWGDQYTFVMVDGFARLNMQIGRSIRAQAVMSNDDNCFFQDGPGIAARIREFVVERLEAK